MRTPLRIIGLSLILAGASAGYTLPAFASHNADDGRYYYDDYGRRYYDDYNSNRRYYNDSYRSVSQESGDRLENFICYYYDAAGLCTNYTYSNSRPVTRYDDRYDRRYNDECDRYSYYDDGRCRTRSSSRSTRTSEYDRGYEDGYDRGYEDGRDSVRRSSRSTSEYDRGYRDGYQQGYDNGRQLRSSYYNYR